MRFFCLMEITYIDVLDYMGTFAFAISGIRVAASRKVDWFGAYVVGLVTALGGGTTRVLLLGGQPFWVTQPSYLVVTGLALLFVIAFGKWVIRLEYTFFIFDAIGLGLFTVVGIDKALSLGFPMWIAISMGMITGSVGGLIRDLLVNQVPLILRKDIYAIASILGGLVYYLCLRLSVESVMAQSITFITVIVIRFVSVKYHIGLPVLKEENKSASDS